MLWAPHHELNGFLSRWGPACSTERAGPLSFRLGVSARPAPSFLGRGLDQQVELGLAAIVDQRLGERGRILADRGEGLEAAAGSARPCRPISANIRRRRRSAAAAASAGPAVPPARRPAGRRRLAGMTWRVASAVAGRPPQHDLGGFGEADVAAPRHVDVPQARGGRHFGAAHRAEPGARVEGRGAASARDLEGAGAAQGAWRPTGRARSRRRRP